METIDLRSVYVDAPPQSAYELLRMLLDQVGYASIRDGLIQMQAEDVISRSAAMDGFEPQPEPMAIRFEDGLARQKSAEEMLWTVNEELVKAGYLPWKYESFAACIADLAQRAGGEENKG